MIHCCQPISLTQDGKQAGSFWVLRHHLLLVSVLSLHLCSVPQNTVGWGEQVLIGDQGATADVIINPVRIFALEELRLIWWTLASGMLQPVEYDHFPGILGVWYISSVEYSVGLLLTRIISTSFMSWHRLTTGRCCRNTAWAWGEGVTSAILSPFCSLYNPVNNLWIQTVKYCWSRAFLHQVFSEDSDNSVLSIFRDD